MEIEKFKSSGVTGKIALRGILLRSISIGANSIIIERVEVFDDLAHVTMKSDTGEPTSVLWQGLGAILTHLKNFTSTKVEVNVEELVAEFESEVLFLREQPSTHNSPHYMNEKRMMLNRVKCKSCSMTIKLDLENRMAFLSLEL